MRAILLLGMLAACNGDSTDGEPVGEDRDDDGFSVPEDCDDADPSVYPGAPDTWYDGIDHDCAGNDDYDQDGDGHASASFGGDDCVDANADISPDAVEVPYDGIDNDCDPATGDTDPDGDGFLPPDDCDDEDPDVYPGASETLSDGIDSDCDGGDDTASFSFGGLSFNQPSSPRLARTDNHLALGVTALSMSGGTLVDSVTNGAVVLFFPPDGLGDLAPVFAPTVFFQGEPIGGIDLVSTGGEVWGATTYFSNNNQYGWLSLVQLPYVPGVGYIQGQVSSLGAVLTDFDRVEASLDAAGVVWACTSDQDAIAYLRGDVPFPSPGGFVEGTDAAGGCFFEPDSATPLPLVTCGSDGACTTWDTDPDGTDATPVVSASQLRSTETWLSVRERDGVLTAVTDGDGIVVVDASESLELLSGSDVLDAEAMFDSAGDIWIVAVVDGGSGPQLLLASGDPGGVLVERTYEVRDGARELTPEGSSVWVDDDRVFLAVSASDGGSDAVGWLVLGR